MTGIVIPDGGTIGSTSDTDAINIASDGKVTLSQPVGGTLTLSGDFVPSTPLSHRNMIINGAMQVAQRGTSATVSDASNEGYSTLDRWYLNFNSSLGGSATFSKDSDAPTGFSNSLKIQCASTATPSGSTNQYMSLQYSIEAQDLQQLGYGSSGAKTATLSFYAKRAGTDWGKLSVQFYKPDNTIEYSLPTATTLTTSWARYTVPVPANTATAIDDDNGVGLRIGFVLAGNSSGNYASTADTSWGSTRKDYASDIGNLLSDTSNIFYLTGVQLELGSVATPFEMRSYGEELARCQRYFQVHQIAGAGVWNSTTRFLTAVHLPVAMRATPTMSTLSGVLTNINVEDDDQYNISSISLYHPSSVPYMTSNLSQVIDVASSSGRATGEGGLAVMDQYSDGFTYTSEL